MAFRHCPLAAALLIAAPALVPAAWAQTPPAPKPAAPAATPAPASQPAPMPDPLMAPDLQTINGARPSLTRLVSQSAWQDGVIAAAQAQWKILPYACAAGVLKPTGKLTIFSPPQFDASGQLVGGIWNEAVSATGCGQPRQINILTVLQPGTPPQRIPIMPGDSHADPATQKNALQYAQAIAVRAAPPGCKEQMFVDTKFDGYTGLPNPAVTDGRDGRAWREEWLLNACGKGYVIGLTFTPNAQGTQLVGTNPEPLKGP